MKINLENIVEFIKFCLVGISNTLISLLVYYTLIALNLNYIVANTLGFIISVLNSYYWNGKYVFKVENKLYSLIKVFCAYGITFGLNTLFLIIMVDLLLISKFIAPILNIFFIVPINFFVNKYWVYK